MNEWWAGDPEERFWMEITDRPDIGADLNAPLTGESGKPQWSYDFVAKAAPGDLVFHFDKRAGAIVGQSVIDGEAWNDNVVWGAHGTSARGLNVTPYSRPGQRRAVTGFELLARPVPLDQIRDSEASVLALKAGLEARHGKPLYFPFAPYSGQGLRPFQGYMVKMPQGLVELLQLPQTRGGEPQQRAGVKARTVGADYREADEAVAVAIADPMIRDPALMERALRSHRATQNQLAAELRAHGMTPLSPSRLDPDWDLAWEDDGAFVVVEVKSITRANEEKQLRLAIGQVLRYAQALRAKGHVVRTVIATSEQPADSTWTALCDSLGIELTWPDEFRRVVAKK